MEVAYIADSKVERALYGRAVGVEYKEKKIVIEMDKDGNQKPARIETAERYLPPDVTACIFWLKNRRRDQWADRQVNKIESEGKIFVHVIDEETMQAVQELMNNAPVKANTNCVHDKIRVYPLPNVC